MIDWMIIEKNQNSILVLLMKVVAGEDWEENKK
jgi:hypothetical protein